MTEIKEYKGNKIIELKKDENDKYPFSFGVSKARLVLENLDDIKKFILEYSKD
jgi:hypothetical protein